MAQTLNLSIETVNDWIKRNYWLDFWAYPESKDWYYDPNLQMFRKN